MEHPHIEFFHDVICSFCFPMSYNVRKLKAALPDIVVKHRSVALVRHERDFDRMFGSWKNAKPEIIGHWASANKIDELHRFNIEGMKKTEFLFPTSIKPLRACVSAKLAVNDDLYWDLFDELQKAFFVQSKNIGTDEEIFNCVKNVDLDFEKWKEIYHSEQSMNTLEEDFAFAENLHISSLPHLIINKKHKISGVASFDELFKAATKSTVV